MVSQEVLDRIRPVLAAAANINAQQVTPAMSLATDLGIDSLTMVKLVVAVEDRFGTIIPDQQWAQFSTVSDLVDHLERISAITPEWSSQP